jgi:hypothetical protein
MYVCENFEPGLWTVGFYRPDGTFVPEGDYKDREEAGLRTGFLNGSGLLADYRARLDRALDRIAALEAQVHDIIQMSPAGAFGE